MSYKQSPFPMVKGTTSHKEALDASPLKDFGIISGPVIAAVIAAASAGVARASAKAKSIVKGTSAAMKGAVSSLSLGGKITEKKTGGIGDISEKTT